jgi:diguanylate cyclase (GGDEF)-like protein
MNIFTAKYEKAWKEKSINHLLIGLSIFGTFAFLASILRAENAGIQISHLVHASLYSLVLLITFFRKQLSTALKANFIIIGTTLISFVGIYNWGLYSASYFWLLVTPLLLTLFFSYKHALIFIGLTVVFLMLSAYMYHTEQWTMPIDADEYQKMYSSWATVIFGDLIMMVMLVILLSNMRKRITELISNLEEQQHKISQRADFDDLTGLTVFRVLSTKLTGMLKAQHRDKRHIAVFFMDLDGFKRINDSYGHYAGDMVLKEVALRMKACLRDEDVLCRMGGDEFVALCSSSENKPLEVELIANRLLDAVSIPIAFESSLLTVGVSIGIAVDDDSSAMDAEDMVKKADDAMYEVKRAGKHFYKLSS